MAKLSVDISSALCSVNMSDQMSKYLPNKKYDNMARVIFIGVFFFSLDSNKVETGKLSYFYFIYLLL